MTRPAAAALVAAVRQGGHAPANVRSLEPLRPLIVELRRRLALGPGIAVVEDFPLDVLDEDELGRASYLLGSCLGRPGQPGSLGHNHRARRRGWRAPPRANAAGL